MPYRFIQLDDSTLKSLDRIAQVVKRSREELIRQAVKEAIRKRENEEIREACLRQPDSAASADDWSTAEEWRL